MNIDIEALYRRYGPMVLRRCRQLLRDEAAALDAMQDVFVKILTGKKNITPDALCSLLYRIATNVCLNHIRSNTRRHGQGNVDTEGDLLERIAAAEDPASQIMASNFLDRLFRTQQASTRTIAVLHLLDGMTLEEVAAEVGMSVSGVRKRLRLLRSQVKELEVIPE